MFTSKTHDESKLIMSIEKMSTKFKSILILNTKRVALQIIISKFDKI